MAVAAKAAAAAAVAAAAAALATAAAVVAAAATAAAAEVAALLLDWAQWATVFFWFGPMGPSRIVDRWKSDIFKHGFDNLFAPGPGQDMKLPKHIPSKLHCT